jgi:hypothetical protein
MTGVGIAVKAPPGGFTLSSAARCEAPPTTCGLKGRILAPTSAGERQFMRVFSV